MLSTAKINLRKTAITFFGKKISYKVLLKKVEALAASLYSLGVRHGDIVMVALPNIPQAVYTLYAVNRIGAVAAFVSPLSAECELKDCIVKCKSKVIIALDSLYEKLIKVVNITEKKKLVLTSALDELWISFNRKKENVYSWSELLNSKENSNLYLSTVKSEDTAVILFSGGTTGKPKAVELTNLNLNALAEGTAQVCGEDVRGVKMLSVLPVFHGFGLGICIHTVLYFGGECILVPRFDAVKAGRIIKHHKPHFIAVVPAMLEPLMNSEPLAKADFSKLKGVFSGGDSLSDDLEESFNKFLLKHNSEVRIRQGYGLTECVAASCLMPKDTELRGSVGLPYPQTVYKITDPETKEEVERGCVGEICIRGKTVMKGYLDDKAETDNVLRRHEDGFLWLHTGDLGYMDQRGYVFFTQRLKRLIVSNGHNVYPSELEKALSSSPLVSQCCAIGIKDLRKTQVPVMFVVPKENVDEKDAKEKLLEYISTKVSKHCMPVDLIFITALPKTSFGKICYTKLQKIAEEIYRKKRPH